MGVRGRRFGRYELLAELGRGGMAEVHLARLEGIGGFSKLVALKLMLPHLSQNEQFVEQFLNEARIAARISHPNVCQVFEIGEADGQLFLVIEYLEGATWEELARVLGNDPATLARVATGVFAQACEGLHHAHELRNDSNAPTPVVHRDISPQNLFITVDGVCKILDFGVAKMGTASTRTRTGVLKGKLPYMSPEQVKGQPLAGSSDVFALGVVLWEVFANRPLFLRESEYLTLKAITEDQIDPVSRWETAFGPELDALLKRTLERDQELRPSMRELANELRRLGDGWGGAMTSTEIGELVRSRCRDKLAARNSELATLDTEELDLSSRNVPTAVDRPAQGSMALRADSVPMGHARRRRWPFVIGGLAIATAATITAVVVAGGAPAEQHEEAPATVAMEVVPPKQPVAAESPSPAPAPAPSPKEPVAKARIPTKRAAPRAEPVPDPAPTPAVAKLDPGMLSINVNPSARIYVDGVFIDETPLYQIKVSAGRHELRIVPADGTPKAVQIKIEPGRVLNLGTMQL
jgi:serine/threonine protein kinase